MTHPGDEARRLEELWAGSFGDDYVDRNASSYDERQAFWESVLERCGPRSVLEVGCNVGGNLRWIAPALPPGATVGIDVNRKAVRTLHELLPDVDALCGPARDLPFRDRRFDLTFTMGVLIHQPDSTLPLVMAELVRCSARYVLVGEYAPREGESGSVEVPYRGQDAALFRRDYGALLAELFPELDLVDTGFLGRDTGWDDVTWWLFERSG